MNRYWGLDRTVLRNIDILEIDLNKARLHDVKIDLSSNPQGYKIDDITIDRLEIKDNIVFDKLILDYAISNGVRNYYCELELTLSTIGQDHNNKIPLSMYEYINKLDVITQYIDNTYGVRIDIENTRFKEVEINITGEMEYPYKGYDTIFRAIALGRNKKRYSVAPIIYLNQSLELRNADNKRSFRLKIYDKTTQLKTKGGNDKNLLRIEYVLKSYDVIQSKLGASKVLDITDDIIKEFLNEYIQEDIFNAVERYIHMSNKELKALYKQVKSECKRGFVKEFGHRASHVGVNTFDLEQVFEICKKDIVKSKNNKRYRDTLTKTMPPQLQNNYAKLSEIHDKFILV